MEKRYRHEWKYLCSRGKWVCLENGIRGLLELDSHTGEQGNYQIRSLYFDDYEDTCYYDNENGVDPREKFRIRIYNGDPKSMKLELKRKERYRTRKWSCPLSMEQYERILQGTAVPDNSSDAPLLRRFCFEKRVRIMRPKVIVEYNRIPYVYRDGNVRITYDTEIGSSVSFDQFFADQLPVRRIMPAGMNILEVKYDAFLPDMISHAVQTEELRLTNYSKYYLCRRHGVF